MTIHKGTTVEITRTGDRGTVLEVIPKFGMVRVAFEDYTTVMPIAFFTGTDVSGLSHGRIIK